MCGIAGFIADERGLIRANANETLRAMTDCIVRRGPDAQGHWHDAHSGIALGHRRLSILDVSNAGAQPMHSRCGRYVIAYNGEIYNHLDLRKRLSNSGSGICWQGTSDTETIVEAISAWGLVDVLKQLNGMFAFALWDKQTRTLTLARDRIGEKPLYYGWDGASFIFASELSPILKACHSRPRIDKTALSLFMRYTHVPAPYSIYENFYKLTPGCYLSLSLDDLKKQNAEPQPYWSLFDTVEQSCAQPFAGDLRGAANILESLLSSSIDRRMLSDVPLGAFLSGGIDSSLIVALMQRLSPKPVKTFTIGFDKSAYNEAEYAKKVAKHIGTEHHEFYVSPEETQNVIPQLSSFYDEPFADSSQIPTYLVCKMARQHVTVCLSGDAGDELFGGYYRYFMADAMWRRISWMPRPLRLMTASALRSVSTDKWSRIIGLSGKLLGQKDRVWMAGDKVHKFATALEYRERNDIYRNFLRHWRETPEMVKGAREPYVYWGLDRELQGSVPFAESMMYHDTLTYLPNDILVKVDRAAMAVSLETRIPFLDPDLIAFAWSLPLQMKCDSGKGKLVVREVLKQFVPDHLFERPKAGFAVPIADWLRGSLREWAEDLLSSERIQQDGYFDASVIRQKWDEHLSGKHNWEHDLWAALMFQSWNENRV